ncbi:acetyl-CoA carboxylase biotin carboxyl carrier protein [Amycolatopsis minnesotensis]|uniref:Biotin carboxyl carrier protein of acetyl-CoA carboxylase n=1 Tax=Amycolatopsis minnesotensis TaxID=337894 RepID=A0ABP5D2L9_9PSEU
MDNHNAVRSDRALVDELGDAWLIAPSTEPTVRDLLVEATHTVRELLATHGRPPSSMTVRAGGIAIELAWDGPQTIAERPVATAEPVAAPVKHHIGAPTVGVFYRAPAPGAEPFVAVGDTVKAGQQVGVLEVMKLMVPVEAGQGGTIVAVLRTDGEQVEFDEPLFELAPITS